MIQEEFKEPIFEFAKQLSDFNEVTSITLFGSVSKGEAISTSDIDVFVIRKKEVPLFPSIALAYLFMLF